MSIEGKLEISQPLLLDAYQRFDVVITGLVSSLQTSKVTPLIGLIKVNIIVNYTMNAKHWRNHKNKFVSIKATLI